MLQQDKNFKMKFCCTRCRYAGTYTKCCSYQRIAISYLNKILSENKYILLEFLYTQLYALFTQGVVMTIE